MTKNIIIAVLLVMLIISIYFNFSSTYRYRKIQDNEIMAVVPYGYHIAQQYGKTNELNYIEAKLDNDPENEVVLLLEWNKPEIGGPYMTKHPVIVKVLKFNHENDNWQEITKRNLFNDSNIIFDYKLINIEGDKTDKIILLPYYTTDINVDADGNLIGIKENPTMHQDVCILSLENGSLVDLIHYGSGGPTIDNITHDGGTSSAAVINGSLYFAEYVKEIGTTWKGCHKIRYTRYVYNKDKMDPLKEKRGCFLLYGEAVTANEYCNDNNPNCKHIITGIGALFEEPKSGEIHIFFSNPIRDKSILYVEEKDREAFKFNK